MKQIGYRRQEVILDKILNYMKKIVLLTVITATLALLSILVSKTQGETPRKLLSPLIAQETNFSLNQWFPKGILGVQSSSLEISARSAFFIDSKSGGVLFAKEPNLKLPIASLVKVMTALIALEHKNIDDQFIVSRHAADMEPDKMLLIAGEKLTLRELLDGIFLISANDAAEVLAEGSVKSRKEFIKLMNNKATQLGMKDTYFANPTGLDEDDNNSYSTVYDLSILTRYLIRNYPLTTEISQTEHIYLPQTENHQDYDMYSGINLLTTYPGVIGFKTGYTPEAGLTLITLARKDGHEIIGVLLGSGDRRDEARELLDYSFKKLGV